MLSVQFKRAGLLALCLSTSVSCDDGPTGSSPVAGAPAGGVTTGGDANGGAAVGGVTSGGAPAGGVTTGGSPVGGVSVGGTPAGGVSAGGTPAGGVTVGGAPAGGGEGGSPVAPCEIGPIMERNSCSASGCHAPPVQGSLDLSGGGLELQLLNAPAHTVGCEGRKLVDGRDWRRSLLLHAVGAEAAELVEGDPCELVMPPSGEVSEEDKLCISDWVEHVASLDDGEPMEPLGDPPSLASALRKVKALISGQELTEAELESAQRDGLRAVIEGWTEGADFEAKMLDFFALTLQQRFESNEQNQFGRLRSVNSRRGWIERAMQEVIPRTALHFIMSGQPLSEIATTRSFMLSTAALAALLYPDQTSAQRGVDHFVSGDPSEVPSQLSQQVSQKRWYAEGLTGTCTVKQRELLEFIGGFINDNRCAELDRNFRFEATPLSEDDYSDWRLVSVEANAQLADNEVTLFYDIPTLRSATSVQTRLPRVGYYTSNAFMNQWPTNVDNQFRVTVNQALIAGLHISFASSEPTEPIQMDALDAEHAEPGSECYGCHRQLDPMRVYFGAHYNADYRLPTTGDGNGLLFDPAPRASFAFRGETNDGGRVGRLGANIASHPRWSAAWVQKVCLFVNSARCDESDPLFVEIKERFGQDQLFIPMLIDVLSSPLTTGLEAVDSRDGYPIVSVTRREQLCGLLAARTRKSDICERNIVRRSIGLIPVDSYARGAVDFTQPTLASPFYFAAAEAVCEASATVVVTGTDPEFSFRQEEAVVLNKVVTQLMSILPSDPRHPQVLEAFTAHFTALRAEGVSKRDALRSVFTLGCLSPDVMGLGL